MSKKRFKVGDKVRVVPNSPKYPLYGNRILTVVEESLLYVIAHCRPNDRLNKMYSLPMYFQPSEIKRAYLKGEQLTVDFFEN